MAAAKLALLRSVVITNSLNGALRAKRLVLDVELVYKSVRAWVS